jgi:non-ribosomal peptide synthetase component F
VTLSDRDIRQALKDGQIKFPENGNLARHFERWAKVRGDELAYRFLDFSTERDGVVRDLNWSDFGARNRAVGARLQQVTEPGDRVAILCPQNLEYLVAFFGTLYSGRIAVPLFDPSEPGHVGRLHAVLDPDHDALGRALHRGIEQRPLGLGRLLQHEVGRVDAGRRPTDANANAGTRSCPAPR